MVSFYIDTKILHKLVDVVNSIDSKLCAFRFFRNFFFKVFVFRYISCIRMGYCSCVLKNCIIKLNYTVVFLAARLIPKCSTWAFGLFRLKSCRLVHRQSRCSNPVYYRYRYHRSDTLLNKTAL